MSIDECEDGKLICAVDEVLLNSKKDQIPKDMNTLSNNNKGF